MQIATHYHGGDIYSYSQPLLDFSSNINPLGVPASFKKALAQQSEAFAVYPDRACRLVKQSIAAYLDVAPEMVIPGNGAVELIYQALYAVGKKRVYGLAPTFSEYRRAAKVLSLPYRDLEVFEADFQTVRLATILDRVEAESVVIICNPNNPTGTLIPREELCALATELLKRNCALIVDEAFIEFTDRVGENTMLPRLGGYPNLMVIRAATKFFGMPGVRLGYGITRCQTWAGIIEGRMLPWQLNTAAVIAAQTVFGDREYQKASRDWIGRERPWFGGQLGQLRDFEVIPSQANFFLVRILREGLEANQLYDQMVTRGILIRKPAGFSGLTNAFFRLAIKDRPANQVLIEALKEV